MGLYYWRLSKRAFDIFLTYSLRDKADQALSVFALLCGSFKTVKLSTSVVFYGTDFGQIEKFARLVKSSSFDLKNSSKGNLIDVTRMSRLISPFSGKGYSQRFCKMY